MGRTLESIQARCSFSSSLSASKGMPILTLSGEKSA